MDGREMAGPAFAAGALLLHFFDWPPLNPLWLAALAVLALLAGSRGGRWRWLAWCLAGLCWAGWTAQAHRQDRLPTDLVGQDLRVACLVEDFPRDTPTGITLICRPRSAHRVDGDARVTGLSRRLRLRWRDPEALPRPGELWSLTVRLKPAAGMRNPVGFDYGAWLFRAGIGATGYVKRWPAPRLEADIAGPVEKARRWLAGRMEHLEPLPGAGMLRAVTLGIRDRVDTVQATAFRTTGTAHLFAISGLHVGLVSGFVFLLVRRLWRLSARLCQRYPAPRAAALAGLLAAAVYAALAGFSLPTQRALLMIAVLHAGPLTGRRTSSVHAFSMALLAVLLLDPLAVGGPGFWLSFGAVFFLWLIARSDGQGEGSRLAVIVRALRTQWLLSLAMVPLTVVLFQQVQWLAPLANLVAIPVFGMLILPGALIGLLLLAVHPTLFWPWWLSGRLAEALAGFLQWLAALPLAEYHWSPAPEAIAWMTGLVLMLLSPAGLPGRRLALLWSLPVLFPAAHAPQPGRFDLVLLDVGQGVAAVVRTARHALVYDTGWRSPSGFDTGRAVVLPWLRRQGVAQVDVMIVSHGDLDHRGGARSIDRAMPVCRLFTSAPERIYWRPVTRCRAGQAWHWDGVRFEMLAPTGEENGNDASCVLAVEAANGQRLLLAGDIERRSERRLVRRVRDLAADVLVVPHHGSGTSSSPGFVRAVRPRHALVPAGRFNRYRLPAPEVLARYRRIGSRVRVTGIDGAIACRLGGPGPVSCRLGAPPSPWRNGDPAG